MIIVDTFEEAKLAAIAKILEEDEEKENIYNVTITYNWGNKKWYVDWDFWGENPNPNEEK